MPKVRVLNRKDAHLDKKSPNIDILVEFGVLCIAICARNTPIGLICALSALIPLTISRDSHETGLRQSSVYLPEFSPDLESEVTVPFCLGGGVTAVIEKTPVST